MMNQAKENAKLAFYQNPSYQLERREKKTVILDVSSPTGEPPGGIMPTEFLENDTFESLMLDGTESFSFDEVNITTKPLSILNVNAIKDNGININFKVKLRIDTEVERKYLINGGVLQFVLRNMMDNN